MKRYEKILVKILPAILFLLFISILAYIVVKYKNFGITINDLMSVEITSFSITFFFIILLLILNLSEFRRHLSGIKKETLILLFMIILVGFYLREFVVPHTHRIFFDEDLYLGIANSIATENKNILCNYGTPTKCTEGILNKDPSGWPFFVSLFYKIFGTSEELAFEISSLIGTISIFLVFLVVFMLFRYYEDRREHIALSSALLFALTPAHINWSGSVATEIPFTFFSLLTVLAYLLYFRNEKFKSHLLGASLLAFTVQIRPEGVLFISTIVFSFLLFERKLSKKLTDYKFWIPFALLFILIIPHLIHLYSHMGGSWGAPSGKKFGLEYAPHNLSANTIFWFTGDMHPVFFTILSLIGISYLFAKEKSIFLLMAFWFISYFLLFGVFYAGGVDNGGIGFRFVNIYLAPATVLGGYGAFALRRLLNKLVRYRVDMNLHYRNLISYSIVTILILLSFLFLSDAPYAQFKQMVQYIAPNSQIAQELTRSPIYPPVKPYPLDINGINITFSKTIGFIMIPNKQAQYARDMHDILVMRNIDKINNTCYVLTHNPSIFLIHGKNSLQTWFGSNTKVMNEIFNKTDCVIWLEGAWCLFEPHKSGVCMNMHDRYNLTMIDQYIREENPDQKFALYRVERKDKKFH